MMKCLTREEEEASKRVAKDKHLLPLAVFFVLIVVEVLLLLYGVISSIANVGSLPVTPPPHLVPLNEKRNS